jgi:hypothetical protein
MWAFQEGRLAKSLFIQFRDHAVPIEELLAYEPVTSDAIEDIFHSLHNDTAILLRHRIKKEDSDREDFLGVVSGLRHRATTVASDEPVVLLTLLRLPHKDEPSMADIYRSCRDIPQDIIFANSPRLQLDGFRWAPSTFLIRWSHPSGKSNRSGVVTSREF